MLWLEATRPNPETQDVILSRGRGTDFESADTTAAHDRLEVCRALRRLKAGDTAA
jgi:hypothetical protein